MVFTSVLHPEENTGYYIKITVDPRAPDNFHLCIIVFL